MFEQDNQIIKLFGNNKLLSIKEAFSIGKVKFEFREFDKSRQSGEKTTGSVDIYMDIEKFTYFCEIFKSGRIYGFLRKKSAEQQEQGLKQAKPAFEDYGGKSDPQGNVLSRVMSVTSGDKYPIIIKAGEGPGKKGSNGQIIPDYASWSQKGSKSISIALSNEMAVEIGIAGMRALSIYDIWVANGTQKENLQRINPKKSDGAGQRGSYQGGQRQSGPQGRQQNSGYNNRSYDDFSGGYGSYGSGGYEF